MNQLDSTTKKLKYFNSNCFLVENFKLQSLFVFISIVSQFIYFSYNGGDFSQNSPPLPQPKKSDSYISHPFRMPLIKMV